METSSAKVNGDALSNSPGSSPSHGQPVADASAREIQEVNAPKADVDSIATEPAAKSASVKRPESCGVHSGDVQGSDVSREPILDSSVAIQPSKMTPSSTMADGDPGTVCFDGADWSTSNKTMTAGTKLVLPAIAGSDRVEDEGNAASNSNNPTDAATANVKPVLAPIPDGTSLRIDSEQYFRDKGIVSLFREMQQQMILEPTKSPYDVMLERLEVVKDHDRLGPRETN